MEAYASLDPGILGERVTRRHGGTASVVQALRDATRWLESHLSADGLLEVPKRNLFSLPYQTWRDGPTSNFDERGRMANVVDPIAYLDVQALSADAFEAAASLLERGVAGPSAGSDERRVADRARAELLRDRARALRAVTQATFWMEGPAYYAFAADRAAGGERRVLRAVQSNAGWLLATRFFDDLPTTARERAITGVVRMLFSSDMLTSAGIRGRALRHHGRSFRNYHENVWPVDTFMIAKGLRRHGFHEFADELEARLVSVTNRLAGAWEFIVVDDEGRVVDPRRDEAAARRLSAAARALATEMIPERDIAWTATALLRLKRDRAARAREGAAFREELGRREPWVVELTDEILAGLERAPMSRPREDVSAAPVELSSAYLDQAAGLRRASAVVLAQGFGRVLPVSLARRLRRRLRRPGGGAS